ncbi:MAG TPA: DUF1579 domain-containing protein [Phycisphaerales bacterium]|nr:DUF1579 domain-containing protein [Phycisphaerales bacterium]
MSTDGTDCEMMAEPRAEHKQLEKFVGTWRSKVQLWMGPGEPMQSAGTMVNTMDLGGRFLKQVYTGDSENSDFPDFAGRGFVGFNAFTNQYEGFWIDTAGTQMSFESGSFDQASNSWTMTGKVDMGPGNKVAKRSVITIINDNEHTLEMFMDTPDAGETKVMHIHYTRA